LVTAPGAQAAKSCAISSCSASNARVDAAYRFTLSRTRPLPTMGSVSVDRTPDAAVAAANSRHQSSTSGPSSQATASRTSSTTASTQGPPPTYWIASRSAIAIGPDERQDHIVGLDGQA
jgi:hypothetical protein